MAQYSLRRFHSHSAQSSARSSETVRTVYGKKEHEKPPLRSQPANSVLEQHVLFFNYLIVHPIIKFILASERKSIENCNTVNFLFNELGYNEIRRIKKQ